MTNDPSTAIADPESPSAEDAQIALAEVLTMLDKMNFEKRCTDEEHLKAAALLTTAYNALKE